MLEYRLLIFVSPLFFSPHGEKASNYGNFNFFATEIKNKTKISDEISDWRRHPLCSHRRSDRLWPDPNRAVVGQPRAAQRQRQYGSRAGCPRLRAARSEFGSKKC